MSVGIAASYRILLDQLANLMMEHTPRLHPDPLRAALSVTRPLFRDMDQFNALQPPLTAGERAVVKSYGGWGRFMASYALRPYEDDDAAEGLVIVQKLAQNNAYQAEYGGKIKAAKDRKISLR